MIVSAPELANTTPDRQAEVEDMAVAMINNGPKCVLYNLSFAQVWDEWDNKKTEFLA